MNNILPIFRQKATAGLLMLRRAGLLVGLSLLAASAQAQTISQYQLTPSSGTFTPITGGTGVGILFDDVASGTLPIGFTFRFAGVNYTTFQASSNGYLGFGTGLTGTYSDDLNANGAGAPVAAAFIGDLDGSTAGASAQYVVTGTAPNRVLTMEWLNWGSFNGVASVLSFQTKLYESSGRIAFVYRQEPTALNRTVSIGLAGANTGNFLSLSDSGPNPTASSTVSTTSLVKPATGQVYTFTPGNVWTGAVSTAWSVAGNWNDGVVPTATTNAIIASAANQPIVTGTQACNFLSINGGATITLAANALLTTSNSTSLASTSALVQQAGSELRIGQDLADAGATFTLDPTSLVSFRAGTATTHNLTGAGTASFQNLSLGQQAASDQLSIQSTATVQRLMTLAQGATAAVAAGGSLTLLSNASGTGQIAKDAASSVTGNVTVQRYITPTLNAGAGYRHYSAPITNATTSSLATTGFTPTFNAAYNTSATPYLVTPFPTVFGYNETRVGTVTSSSLPFDQGFVSPLAGDALVQGRGYTVNIPASQTVSFTGTLENGAVAMSGLTRGTNAQSGWHLLGNPFASVVDAAVVTASSTGMDAATYVFQSTGQYAGAYQSFVNGIGAGNNLASGQGFFKRVTTAGTTGTVNFTNAARLAAYASPTFQRLAAETRALVQLDLLNPATQQRDAAYVYFQTGATAGFDANFDAYKLPSGAFPYVALTTAAEPLAVNGLPLLGAADVLLPLTVAVPTTGTFTLEAARVINLPAGKVAYLRDAQTGAVVDLGQQSTYSFVMNSAFSGPRFSLFITSSRLLGVAPASLVQQVALYPNPAHGTVLVDLPAVLRQQALTLTMVNALGQTVQTMLLPATGAAEARSLPLTDLAAGIYSVSIATNQGTITKRLVVK